MGKLGERVKILLDIEKVLIGDVGAFEEVHNGDGAIDADAVVESACELVGATA
jgi:hypothetical protein